MADNRTPTFHPHPSQPKLKLPKGSWDTHCHVFGPKAKFPYAATASSDPADAPKEMLFDLHAKLGIERSVIVHTTVHGTDLRATADAIAAKKGAYLGIALLPLTVTKAELLGLDAAGFRGMRFNYMRHLHQIAPIADVMKFAGLLADVGWHLVIHMESGLIAEMTPMLESSPVPIVIDHMGRVDASQGTAQAPFQALLRMMEHDRIWMKVSGCDRITRTGPPYTDALACARALVEAFPDRVLWGTDWPHPHHQGPTPDDGQLVDIIAQMAPTETLIRKLMVDNPERLYDRRGAA